MAITIQVSPTPSSSPIGRFSPPASRPSAPAPAEHYAGSTEAAPPEALLRAQVQDQARRTALASSLLDTSGPGVATDGQRSSLVSSLSRVDASILEVAKNNNIRVGVVNSGQDMLEMGALKPRSFEDYQQRLPQMREAGDRAATVAQEYERRMEEAFPPGKAEAGFGGFNLSAEEQQKFVLLDREKRAALGAALEGGKLGVIPFTLPRSDNGPSMGMPPQSPGPMPTNLMAALAGAQSPEQFKEYETLLAGINGERLTEARNESLEGFAKYITTLPVDQQSQARQSLEQLKNNPGQIRINQEKHHILVPDLYYRKDAEGQSVRLNLHDTETLMNWGDAAGKSRGRWDEKTNPQGSGMDGQYFRETRRVLVQAEAVAPGADAGHGDLAIHELGHGLQDVVRTKDPAFHDTWVKKLEAAHLTAAAAQNMGEKPAGSVSSYALTNPGEYLAEGVAHYYDDPKLLRTKDPALFALTQEFLEHARTLK